MNRLVSVRPAVRWIVIVALLCASPNPSLAQAQWTPKSTSGIIRNAAVTVQRIIVFAGRRWIVKSGCGLGLDANCWTDSEQSVWVEGGQLHLKIREVNGVWHSAEVYTTTCTPFGTHRFFMVGRLDNLDKNVVAALSLYTDGDKAIGVEFAKWGEDNPLSNAQYVAQPSDKLGNRKPFKVALNGTYSTHSIDRSASTIFKSIHGHYQEPPDAAHLIHEWLYEGSDNPTQLECLRVRINLWLYQGNAPSDGQEVEIIVKTAQLPTFKVFLPVIFCSACQL